MQNQSEGDIIKVFVDGSNTTYSFELCKDKKDRLVPFLFRHNGNNRIKLRKAYAREVEREYKFQM